MSILLSLGMNPDGAELLFSNRIFEVLGQCQFMKAQQPDFAATQMNIDSSAELTGRYQQLLMPTLTLIVSILSSFGARNDTVLNSVNTNAENFA
jgi:nuclear pore complex protein Nup205